MLQDIDNKRNISTPYWSDYAAGIIHRLELKKVNEHEYCGGCPNCGGVDRFRINNYNGEIRVNCRKCNDFAQIFKILREDLQLLPEYSSQKDVINLHQVEEIHPYLTRKRIKLHNAEVDETDLVVPIIDKTGKRQGSQFIDADGNKKFNFGLKFKGCFSVLNGKIKDFAWLCEGFATAAAVTESTGHPAIHCLNAANIIDVIEAFKEVRPEVELIIAGDNDEAGRKVCEKALDQHGIQYVLPDTEGLDWNDVYIARGASFTRKALKPSSVLDEIVMPEDAVIPTQSNYIVKGWLSEDTTSIVFGASNVGKSFFCLDMAYHIGANQDWMGCKVRGGSVLYLQTEGGTAFNTRLVALRNKYPEFKNVKLAVRALPINLFNDEGDIAKIKLLIKEIGKKHGDVKVLCVDTIARATQGQLEENSNSEFSKFLANLDLIRAETGVHIMLVGHTGKDLSKGLRGSYSAVAAAETLIEITLDSGSNIRTAVTTKQRDMELGKSIDFVLTREALGEDEDGDEITTCTIRQPTEEEIKENNKPKISGKNQLLFKQVFYQLRGEGIGKPNPSGAGWPKGQSFWCIDEKTIKDHFKGKLVGAANPTQTYKQAVTALMGAGHIAANEGIIWFLDKDGSGKNPFDED